MRLKLTTWPGRIWGWVRAKWTGVLRVVGGIGLLSLLWCAVIEMPRWQVNRLMFSTDEVTRFELENEARRTVWQFILGFGGLFALFVAWLRVRAMDKTAKAAEENARAANDTARAALEQVKLVERGQITERFTRAIELLGAVDKDGNPALEVRLGGIYALERVARDSVIDHWIVVEVLTAYVRKNSPWRELEETEAVPGADAVDIELLSSRKPDIQAILTVLGRRERSEERESDRVLDLSGTDLRGADLRGAHLERATFYNGDLKGADFSGAQLMGANFYHTQLEGTSFSGAGLKGTLFTEARLERANFHAGHLEGAFFYGAHLEGADFYRAHLAGAFFGRARLEGVKFYDTYLKGANLRQVTGLTCELLMSANDWQDAYRDEALACGAPIPKRPGEEEEKPEQNANEEEE